MHIQNAWIYRIVHVAHVEITSTSQSILFFDLFPFCKPLLTGNTFTPFLWQHFEFFPLPFLFLFTQENSSWEQVVRNEYVVFISLGLNFKTSPGHIVWDVNFFTTMTFVFLIVEMKTMVTGWLLLCIYQQVARLCTRLSSVLKLFWTLFNWLKKNVCRN